jgi:hypothetical protein
MSKKKRGTDTGPLPKSHRNAVLQDLSFKAVEARLDANMFVFRKISETDAGVDATIELRIDEMYSNMKAEVQLKCVDSNYRINKDGSISLSVKPSNLNFLLNGKCPIYMLYHVGINEVRYVWAREERLRIESEKCGWINQKK